MHTHLQHRNDGAGCRARSMAYKNSAPYMLYELWNARLLHSTVSTLYTLYKFRDYVLNLNVCRHHLHHHHGRCRRFSFALYFVFFRLTSVLAHSPPCSDSVPSVSLFAYEFFNVRRFFSLLSYSNVNFNKLVRWNLKYSAIEIGNNGRPKKKAFCCYWMPKN